MRTKILHGLGIGVAAALAALALNLTGVLDRFEAKTWDWRVSLLAKPGPATDRVRLILLDQPSLDWGAKESGLSWPWPREVYRPILDFCRRQGAKTIVFDLIYTEPSAYGVDDDRIFGAAIAQATGFVGAVFLGVNGKATNWPPEIPAPRLTIQGIEDWRAIPGTGKCLRRTATFPIPEVATNADWLANVSAIPDPDAIIRRVSLFNIFDRHLVPSLGFAAYLAGQDTGNLSIKPGILATGRYDIPIDRQGRVILRYRGPSGTHARYSAAAVIQSELRFQEKAKEPPPIQGANLFKDCTVFIGCNAPALLDLRPTPLSRVYPGVEIYATLLDNLLARDCMRDTPWPAAAAVTLFLGFLWGVLTRIGRGARDNILVFLVALPLPAALSLAAYQIGYWLPFMTLESVTAFALVGAVMVNYATEGKQKRFIRGAFKQYLSAEVIDELVRHPERLSLGGEQRTLSIFFSDLQGFTGISEGLTPQALTSLLNDYLTAMTDIIQDEGGTVDKYEGDAIIAFWNAPLAQEDHATRAVRAALRAQTKLAALRPELKSRVGKDMFMRIGLNTGPVVVGNMGSHNRFNYTILGDAANLASRLEGINKQFGTFTLISETTHAAMGDTFAAREISRVAVVGRKAPVRVFEPMFPESWEAHQPDLERFARGLIAFYEGRFDEALTWFEPLQAIDPPAAAYVRKCRELLAAAPARWDGIWVMTEK